MAISKRLFSLIMVKLKGLGIVINQFSLRLNKFFFFFFKKSSKVQIISNLKHFI